MGNNKVIKFNLMGAIGIIILIIAIIVGVIIGVNKSNNKNKNENQNNNNVEQKVQENVSKDNDKNQVNTNESKDSENINAKENTQKKSEEVEISDSNGHKTKHNVKTHESDLGYKMKYDHESFFADKNNENKEKFISLYSNTIGITVEKVNGKIENISNEFTRLSINGNEAAKRVSATNETIDEVYFIKKDDKEYFNIHITCGANFKEQVMPVIDYMISTFEIIK